MTESPERVVRVLAAVAIVGGPLAYLIGGVLEPAAHADGRATIAANAAASQGTDTAHLAAFMIASFLLPVGVVSVVGVVGVVVGVVGGGLVGGGHRVCP